MSAVQGGERPDVCDWAMSVEKGNSVLIRLMILRTCQREAVAWEAGLGDEHRKGNNEMKTMRV